MFLPADTFSKVNSEFLIPCCAAAAVVVVDVRGNGQRFCCDFVDLKSVFSCLVSLFWIALEV